ncbi:hypothetical protein IFR05_011839 [Cadophora sp. M221]|nr:hypothetical protein IFR05_011839 [Cadophora sp. M221]
MVMYMFIPNIVVDYYYSKQSTSPIHASNPDQYLEALQCHDSLLCKIEELATQFVYAYMRSAVSKQGHQRSASKSTDRHTLPVVNIELLVFWVVSAFLFYFLLKLAIASWRQFYHEVLENMTWMDVEAFVESPAATLITLACILQPFIWSYHLGMWTLKTSMAALESLGFEMGVGGWTMEGGLQE